MTLADQLRDARQRAGMSQSEAADACSVSPRTYQGWEAGRGERSVGPRDALAVLEREAQTVADQ